MQIPIPFETLPGVGLQLRPADFKVLPLPPRRTSVAEAIASAFNSPAIQGLIDPATRQKNAAELAKLNLDNQLLKSRFALQAGGNINSVDKNGLPNYTYGADGLLVPVGPVKKIELGNTIQSMQERKQKMDKAASDASNADPNDYDPKDSGGSAGTGGSGDYSEPPTDSGSQASATTSSAIPAVIAGPDQSSAGAGLAFPDLSNSTPPVDQPMDAPLNFPTTTPEDYWS